MAEENAPRPTIDESDAIVEGRLVRSSSGCRPREVQRALRVKDRPEEGRLPTPPPDPQRSRHPRPPGAAVYEEEEEDLAAFLGDELGASSPLESRSFDYDTPNSAASATGAGGDGVGGAIGGAYTDEAFEHLDRLCALTEQILELRDRSSKYFRRVRGLERAKAMRSADRRLEAALATSCDGELPGEPPDEDTGFAESLLDAMLSNCNRDPPPPTAHRRSERASVRSPSSSRQRSRSIASAEQQQQQHHHQPSQGAFSGVAEGRAAAEVASKRTAGNASRNGGPKVSKWTRVKAAFKWERACTNDLAEIAESSAAAPSTPAARYLRIPDAIGAGSWSGSALSPCASELSSPSTPIGRVSSASSSNDEVFDGEFLRAGERVSRALIRGRFRIVWVLFSLSITLRRFCRRAEEYRLSGPAVAANERRQEEGRSFGSVRPIARPRYRGDGEHRLRRTFFRRGKDFCDYLERPVLVFPLPPPSPITYANFSLRLLESAQIV